MNYKEKQLRQLIKNDYIPKSQYQLEISQLKKSTSQELIDTLQKDLGINFLLDYSEIVKQLKGRTIEQLLQEQAGLLKANQALTILAEKRKADLEQEKVALINLAKQKLTNKKEFQTLLNDLENKWQQDRENREQEREEIIADFNKQYQELLESKWITAKRSKHHQSTRENNSLRIRSQ